MMYDIILPADIRKKLEQHAEQSYPSECCGLLFGHAGCNGVAKINEAVTLNNHYNGYEGSGCHYRIDPVELFSYERKYNKKGFDIIGFYHSHPDHAAVTSDEDARQMIPEQLYMILSLRDGICDGILAWEKDISETNDKNIHRVYVHNG